MSRVTCEPIYQNRIDTGTCLVVKAPYELKTKLAEIPGARWSAQRIAWTYPLSPITAKALHDLLGDEAFLDRDVLAMVEEGESIAKSSSIKVAMEAEEGKLEPLPFDTTIKPWNHQLGMIRFAEPLKATLWNVGMGAGKTAAALHLIRVRKHQRVLVVAPLSVVPAWYKQGEIHAPGAITVVPLDEGSSVLRADKALVAWAQAKPDKPVVVVTNYECAFSAPFLAAIQKTEAAKRPLDLIIADECHRLKAPQGKQSVALAKVAARVPYRLGLSGTPLPNSPIDGYGIFRFLDPGVFGKSFVAFRMRYARMGGFQGRQILGFQNVEEFAKRIAPFTYEVSRDVLDLPEATHSERIFKLDAESQKVYNSLRDELIARLDETAAQGGVVTTTNALTKLLRLSQVASGHVGLDISADAYEASGATPERLVQEIHTDKERLLRELLEEIDPSEAVVVFARFTHDLMQIQRAAKPWGCAELSGKKNELKLWQGDDVYGGPVPRVLSAQIQSGAEGVDMTRARYVVYYSMDYSRGRYLQSLARSHRPGQTRPVSYIHLIAEGTTDRLIMKALAKKGEIVDGVLDEIRRQS